MIVQFRVNLGSVDAGRLDLDFRKCLDGAELEVRNDIGAKLVGRGWAVDVTPPAQESEPDVATEPQEEPATDAAQPVAEPTKKKHK